MMQKRVLMFLSLLLSVVVTSCHDDDDDLIGLWERFADYQGAPRYGAASFTLGNKGYVMGGFANNESYKDLRVYDMDRNIWNPISSTDENSTINFPGFARHYGVAAGCDTNTTGYFGLGFYSDYDGKTIYYQPTNSPGSDFTEPVLLNNEVGRLRDWWKFDPTGNNGSGEWTRLDDFPGTARYYSIAFCIGTKIYVGLGYDKEQGDVDDIYEFDTVTEKWNTSHIGYPGGKRRGASVFVIDDIAYIFAGQQNGDYDYRFYSYNPTTQTWTQLRDIANTTDYDYDDDYAIVRMNASTFVIDGYGYVTCGSYSSLRTDTWQYNPTTDLWTDVHNFKGSAREFAVSFSTGRKEGAFITTGRSGSSSSSFFDDTWRLDPYTWDDDD
ncbi:MAG: galactose oxidase [Tannerellaceae bacterium]|nr:galactose oxidase [Tannerellaceae bacterium]